MTPGTVVVVDDDASLLRSLTASLEARGLLVQGAPDGETALELIEKRSPSVVVVDIVMPGLNGFQLCRRLHEQHPQLSVLLFSGKDEPADRLWAKEVGAVELFQKPKELTSLLERVVELAAAEQK